MPHSTPSHSPGGADATTGKSEFLTAMACPTLRWRRRREPTGQRDANEHRIEEGHEVGHLATERFPDGIRIDAPHDAAVEETRQRMSDPETTTLFEAAFRAGKLTARVDILRRNGDAWNVVEVKSSLSGTSKADKEYANDLAYTVMVVEDAGVKVRSAALMLLSRDYRDGHSPEDLFVKVDRTEHAKARAKALRAVLETIDLGLGDKPPEPKLNGTCRQCEYWRTTCLGSGHAHTVLELPKLHHSKLKKLSREGVVDIDDLPADMKLTATQERARTAIKRGSLIVEPGLADALGRIEWPCHYLDFETADAALPLYPGHGCHQKVLTQFSVHHRERPDSAPDHSEFLAEAHENQERRLAEALIAALGEHGSIAAYTHFESTQISRLIGSFPDLATPLKSIRSRLVDFEKLIREHVYHPGFRGSFSLKKVVPALLPDTTYKDAAIQDGDAASTAFARMARGDAGDTRQTRQELLAYCRQDTLVMVRLHEKLARLAGNEPEDEPAGPEPGAVTEDERRAGDTNPESTRAPADAGPVPADDAEPAPESAAPKPDAGVPAAAAQAPAGETEPEPASATPEPAGIGGEIAKARTELLDLSLRNSLLNFRESKSRGVRITGRKPRDLFKTLVNDRRAMTFAARPEPGPEPGNDDEAAEPEPGATEPPAEQQPDNRLQTSYEPGTLDKRLRNTLRFAHASLEEQGVNILYLALGMLHWYEADAGREARSAPLVLVPVTLDRNGPASRFTLRFADEEIASNLSLDQRLRQDFGIRVPEMPESEDLDVDAYLRKVEEAVAAQDRWSVDREAVQAGFFSFNKLLIYKDLDPAAWPAGRAPATHPVVKSLFGGDGFDEREAPIGDDERIDDHLDIANTHQVVDADSSQTLALIDAKNGRNLVIQGPPGTGKSQTITNLVAEAIADDRSVLFVAEKMAALQVVKRRLDEAGIGDACLELHSHKANKRAVLEELKRTLDLERPALSDPDENRKVLSSDRERLDAHCAAVNAPIGDTGLSLHDVVGRLSQIGGCGAAGRKATAIETAGTWSRAEFNERIEHVREFARRLEALGDPAGHTFWPSGRRSLTPHERRTVSAAIRDAADSGGDLARTLEELRGRLKRDTMPDTADGVRLLAATLERAAETPDLSSLHHGHPAWLEHGRTLTAAMAAIARLTALHERYDEILTPEAWRAPIHRHRPAIHIWGETWWRRLLGDYRVAHQGLSRICRVVPTDGKQQLAVIDAILEAQKLEQRVREQQGLLAKVLRRPRGEDAEGQPTPEGTAAWVAALHEDIAAGRIEPEAHAVIEEHLEPAELERFAAECRQVLDDFEHRVETVTGHLEMRPNRTPADHPLESDTLCATTSWLQHAYEHADGLGDIVRFNQQASRLADDGLEAVAKAPHSPEATADLADRVERGWLNAVADAAFAEHPELAEFDGRNHEHVIERFRKLDSDMFQHNRARIAEAHWQRLPKQSGNGRMRVLLREFEKKRRHLPLRKLIAKAGDAIVRTKPVWMMSPLSIAKYIAPGTATFDLVIFDEASQVRPMEALGAVLRGRQTVVVGDNRQLPPTRFFDAAADDGDDSGDETSWTADVESILGLFRANGAPERMLRWHYRSRHESLIATSNQEFYDNRLVLFPSPDAGRENAGLHLELHPETRYERGAGKRYNAGEAAIIADAVMEHAHRRPELTLGVAAFSTPQARRIEDELEMRRREDESGEEFFSAHPEEPFFVKNLENIQGDERDVVMISVGYGRIQGGYLPMNFGPLNHERGERRLNVLITRARRRMQVHANFGAAELDLERTQSRGIRAFKTFLQYAATGVLDVAERSGKKADSPFEDAVAGRLRAAGHRVDHQVGSAGFFIDLAVVDPKQPGRYLLGIECDGATYHSARSARDRDRLRQQVLEDLGWRIHRIWSTDWFENPNREIEIVNEAIRTAATDAHKPPEPVKRTPAPKAEPAPEATGTGTAKPQRRGTAKPPTPKAPPYRIAAPKWQGAHGTDPAAIPDDALLGLTHEIVEIESPVHVQEVAARIMKAAGHSRAGTRMPARIRSLVGTKAAESLVRRRGEFLWRADQETTNVRRRDVKLPSGLQTAERIAPEEIQAALIAAMEASPNIEGDEAIQEASRLFGFKRTGRGIQAAFRAALNALTTTGAAAE